MGKVFSSILLGLMMSSQVFAQRVCGAMDDLHTMLQDPQVAQRRAEIEAQTHQFIQEGGTTGSRAVITIPVVVHVVYRLAAENVSDAQIQSQIDVLNADFRKMNADWTSTPAAFQSVVADAEIQFCLAVRDPSGNATTGITRTSTTVTSFSTNNDVKRTANGGKDPWPSSSYLNIWVCKLGGGLLGYAQFPGGSAATDGVVITYTGFGNTGTAASPYNLGRTATHEVGHWLNLYHIWGDDGTACTGSDLVGDTPNQADENYGCPTFPTVSCSNGPNGDMWMNYMDYTDDACMYMFTAGQKTRMQALFGAGGARVSLLSSLGCQPIVPVVCDPVTAVNVGSVTQNSATVSWAAVSGVLSYNVQYRPLGSSTWTTVNTAGTTLSLTGLATGTTYEVQVQTVCASSSGNYVASGFTTSSAAVACSNNYEPNDTRYQARYIPVNTDIQSMIATSADNDYFSFENSAQMTNIRATLTNLPSDYDLRLYNNKGVLLQLSQNAGTANEMVIFNNAPVDTYFVRAYAFGSNFSAASCYTLNVSTSSTAYRLDRTFFDYSGKPTDGQTVLLYPNPSTGHTLMQMDLQEAVEKVEIHVYDFTGRLVRQYRFAEAEGFVQYDLEWSDMPNGVYPIVVTTSLGTETRKLILNR